MKKVEELVVEATQRAYEAAMINAGKEPSTLEITTVLLQSQLAVLAQLFCESEDDLADYWKAVIAVIKGVRGGSQGEAS